MKSKAWVAAFLLALVVAAVCVRLGFWQLSRLEQRREFNAALSEAMARPPLDLAASDASAVLSRPEENLYRTAIASGRFLGSGEIILRGRAQGGRPGVHLVAPFRLDSGEILLVNRGFVPAADATTLDPRPFRDPEPVRLLGILQAIPPAGADPAPLSVEAADTAIVTHRRLPPPPGPSALYLQELPPDTVEAQPPFAIPTPTLDEGPHLGYAVQWFSFAAIALIGFFVTAWVRTRDRSDGRSEGV